ncbi:MAG: HD domain-containing protein [Oscillospiraceae bacterium]|nr:HD domain-containing protein [Oscillospiraceae bacterium]
MTYEQLRSNEEVRALIQRGNENLGVLGYTDHSAAHCALVAERAADILAAFGYDGHHQELVKMAGFLHDIGNAVNRKHHAEYGALLAWDILSKTDLPLLDRVAVVAAIGNHDESTGGAMDEISAALIIADKTDVRRNRVRTRDLSTFDIHDRVNYAVTGTHLEVDAAKKVVRLDLQVDESICSMFDYFDIFLSRMQMSRRACDVLGATFSLTVNGGKVL